MMMMMMIICRIVKMDIKIVHHCPLLHCIGDVCSITRDRDLRAVYST